MKKLLITMLLLTCTACITNAEQYIPNEAKLEYNQGVDYYKAGQYDLSMKAFRRAISIDPNYIDAYYNLGSILEYLRQEDAALAIFKQIIVRKPDDYESVYKAANLCILLGQIDNAKSYLTLIPVDSPIYSKAQELAKGLNTDIQTLKSEKMLAENSETTKFDLTNGMYNNLPSPTGITTDKLGNIYVACFSDNMIYKITPDGKRIIFVKDSKINGPIAMVSDNNGNIYVSNYTSNNVIKITPTGEISTLISNVDKPYGMNVTAGMLFVSSQGSNSVLRYKL